MLQFNSEILVSYAQAICYLCLGVISYLQGIKKKISVLKYSGFLFFLFMVQFFSQAISYTLVLENYELAYNWKVINVLATLVQTFFSILFIDYIHSHRFRISLLLFVGMLSTIEFCILIFTNGLVPYYFIENEEIIATSIGKVGIGLIIDMSLSGLNVIMMLRFFTQSYLQAPRNLKTDTKKLAILLWVCLVFGSLFNIAARLLPNNQFTLILYSSMGFLLLIFCIKLLITILHKPQVLYILPFYVDRLSIIHNSGICLYDFNFSPTSVNYLLLSGFIQGLQQLSLELLQKGVMREIILEKGVLIFRKMKLYTVCLVTSRSSHMLMTSVDNFTEAFEKRFQNDLESFSGEISMMGEAEPLIRQYFEYVPIRA